MERGRSLSHNLSWVYKAREAGPSTIVFNEGITSPKEYANIPKNEIEAEKNQAAKINEKDDDNDGVQVGLVHTSENSIVAGGGFLFGLGLVLFGGCGAGWLWCVFGVYCGFLRVDFSLGVMPTRCLRFCLSLVEFVMADEDIA
ncbi:hypothetical protein ACOSP7_004763 [Xanthoceras sorbifolium]